jgi:hypothetical protein
VLLPTEVVKKSQPNSPEFPRFGLVSRESAGIRAYFEVERGCCGAGRGLGGFGMPRVSAEDQERRDALIFQLYLAGVPYRQIAARSEVRLSVRGVQLAIDRQRARREDQRSDMGETTSLLIERYEQLFQVSYRKAMQGELRANDQCRKLLVEIGRLHGLEGVRTPTSPPGDGDDYGGDYDVPANVPVFDPDPDDQLARFRLP